MNTALPDEPEQAEEPDEDRQQQHYNEMYARQYENDHTWEQLQEDEYGNLRMVGMFLRPSKPWVPAISLIIGIGRNWN